ncbi:FAD-dependent oxidoreductase [Sedimentitalea sp. JM2-8]|uniref:FAD-dependent oxidoreductase n=1 Tax=Sedimentitalea xiamensis TaxID=3050037 RepID=A0ABT7FH82_9RHOB|nr:FAD-dependent oxidoreductase [Sedimentitalea xiamensis]MDK3074345.1 FAD-dependent oxidoreductase [Sedimentitalea xiamensis]
MKADVTVIGAGIIGAQTAVQLAERGLKVLLVDPGPPGGEQAASFGNAAWLSSHSVTPPSAPGIWKQVPRWLSDPLGPLSIRPAYLPKVLPWLLRYLASGSTEEKLRKTASELRSLLKDAPRVHAEVAARAGVPELINAESGLMHVYRDKSGYEADALGWRIRRELGIVCEEIEADELARLQPDLSGDYRFAVNVPEAGQCMNPAAYCAALVDYSQTRGASHVAARAVGFRSEGGKLMAVRTTQGEIACDAAVISCGARSAGLAAEAGDRVPLESERGYHVTVEGGSDLTGPTTSVMVSDRKVVISRLASGVRCAGQVEIASPDASPDWRRAEIIRTHLGAVFPGLDVSEARVWMGLRPSLPDGKPVIAAARGISSVVHCFGHGHVGLVSSARSGLLAAQLVTGETPEIDLTPFAAARFRR